MSINFPQRLLLSGALLLWLPLLPVSGLTPGARADFPSAQPYPAIRYEHIVRTDPARQIFVAKIDLTNPNVDVRVSRSGPDPDGADEFETVLQKPSIVAEREHFEIAVNGDFFEARNVKDAEGAKSGFVTGIWAKVVGPAATDGYVWGPAQKARPALIIDAQGRPRIAITKDVPVDARQVVAGSDVILKSGLKTVEDTPGFSRTTHPRTAVGIADNGKTLVLVVVDGRNKGVATGMSLTDLSALMKEQGCTDALNLDGGGSSEMVIRNPETGLLQVMNNPSDGRERSVGNVLGVSIRGSLRTPIPPAPVVVPPVPMTPPVAAPPVAVPPAVMAPATAVPATPVLTAP